MFRNETKSGNSELKKSCRPAEVASMATGTTLGALGGSAAYALFCVGTGGIGCVLAFIGGVVVGASTGAVVGEKIGEGFCE